MRKHAIKITDGLWDAYAHYKKKKGNPIVSRKEYVDICHRLNRKISEKIIKESIEFKIPFKLGTLSIVKYEQKITIRDGKIQKNRLVVDWEATWKYWNEIYTGMTNKEIRNIKGKIPIYQTNEHSNGYIMRWLWNKNGTYFQNKTAYKFKPTKQNRLDLAAHIKSDDKSNDYYLLKKRIIHTEK